MVSPIALRPAPSDTLAFAAAPEVTAAIVRVLRRKGVPKADHADYVQTTLVRAIAAHDRPDSVGGWASLAAKIAADLFVDEVRKKSGRRKNDVGLCDDADERGAIDDGCGDRDPVDARRQLDLLRDMVADGDLSQQALEVFEAVSCGVSQSEIAAELGMQHQSVRNLVHRARARYAARWASIACATILVIVVVWALAHRDGGRVAHPPPRETPPASSEPAVEKPGSPAIPGCPAR